MADNFFRISVEYEYASGVACVNSFCVFGHHDELFIGGNLSAEDIAELFIGSDLPQVWEDLLTSNDTLVGVTVRELLEHGSTAIPDEAFIAIGEPGIREPAANQPPDELCAILAIKTDAAVRSGHGYMAMPRPWDPAYLTGDVLETTGAYWSSLQDAVDSLGHWKAGGSIWGDGDTYRMGIYSRTRRDRDLPNFAFGATDFVVRSRIRWRNSRQTAP